MRNELNRLVEASNTYDALFAAIKPRAEEAAWKVIEARKRAYREVFGEKDGWYGGHRYLFSTNRFTFYVGETALVANCIENGCRGGSDEDVGTITLKPEHFTDEGLQAEHEEALAEFRQEVAAEAAEKARARIARKEHLKNELAKLEGGAS